MKSYLFLLGILTLPGFSAPSESSTTTHSDGNTTVNIYEETGGGPAQPDVDFVFGPAPWYGGYYGGPWEENTYYYHDHHYHDHNDPNHHWEDNSHYHENYHEESGHGGGHGR